MGPRPSLNHRDRHSRPPLIATSGAAHHVGGVESFGPLLAFELNRIALVQCLISILLNSREVYKDILTSGTLDKPVSLGSVEPLDHAIFLQANSLSNWIPSQRSSGTPRPAVDCPRQILVDLDCDEGGETITPLAFRTSRTMHFRSSLMMLWQELELSARKICLPEP